MRPKNTIMNSSSTRATRHTNTFLVVLFAITLVLPTILCGQIRSSYTIGGIGNFGTNVKISTYSNPIMVSGTQCFTVTNGLAKFMPVGMGEFFTSCEVNLDYVKLSISIFPNPTSNFTVIKFLNQIQLEDKFRVQLYTSVGDLVDGMDVTQKQFLAGFHLPMEKFTPGLYYIQISSNKILQTYKIFKI